MTSVEEYAYPLPDRAIAQTPIEPRHDSRLLDTRDLTDHRFLDLPELLEPGDLVVVNRTKVRPARLYATKRDTGGSVELLLLRRLDRRRWEALVRPARRIRPGVVLEIGPITGTVLTEAVEGAVEIDLDAGRRDVDEVLGEVGEMPLPPYIRTRLDRPDRYQTMFARTPGSAAAPTAGLHFTEEVVEGLRRRGIELASVDLEVGLATFRPIASAAIEDHRMHEEVFRVDRHAVDAVKACRDRGGRVVAIGTTVVRVLETVATGDGRIEAAEGATDLYLSPGSEFSVVDLLVTNFHLPKSSLIVLVSAFMGPGWREAYETALDRGYRFLSFGDAMLCAREVAA
jgi:S-adenosylmethionine:tRNA ribosyltransferase-isomerase